MFSRKHFSSGLQRGDWTGYPYFNGCVFLAFEAYERNGCYGPHVVELPTLLEHVRTCVGCLIFRRAIENLTPHLLQEGRYQSCILCMTGGYDPDNQWNGILTVRIIENEMDDGSKKFQLFRRSTVEPFFEENYDYSGEKRNRFAQSLHVVEDSSSQAAFDRAAKWLAHCVENDKACDPPDDEFMPMHLINVGSASQSPFLFRTTGTRQPYACLSYCWGPGSDAILKTTTSNIEDHYQKIPEFAMPEAIRDAVRVCRGLKIPFLWVDSLCLVQDDTEAWLTGAAQMSQIYLNSHLTIAALEPGTCRASFLGPQKFGDRNWQRLVRPVALDEAADQGHDLLIRPNSDASPRDSPYSLDKRAWCLQESMLPNRRLCFDGNEMIWECLCRQLCECGHTIRKPLTIRHVENGAALKVNRLKATPILSDPRPHSFGRDHVSEYSATWGHIHEMRTTWRRLVGVYSRRQMTRGDDKLRAIAGLAKIFAERFQNEGATNNNDEYLAGLWKHEVHLDLSWAVTSLPSELEDTASRSGSEGPRWNVPTWSWASTPGHIAYDSEQARVSWKYTPQATDACQLVEAHCERENAHDEMSAVIQGRLSLRGALVQVELLAEVESTETLGVPHHFEMRITRDQGCADRVAWARSSNEKVNRVLLDHQKHQVGLQEGASREPVVGAAGEYYCFRIFSWVADTGKVYGGERQFMGPETWFLVLKKSQRVKGAMERIGIGSAETSDSEPCPVFEEYEKTTISIV
ncbi:uncharacterized protein NECHADRAFT_82337 [Fusarium vanettenii 77-13-4]|uniref:Heterokaryon incompatibility domain-containing protein n=1 Tax=Fusarium vanettenii (strain ATCC MYA-4622 / CBS 123669 / FGSC 9596 / NRRL 45880 / 77-13-4) TaxID=660122 RepID=C7ZMR2_FUSV7|nr:uncharacterized protein NECHADRAFT_82337 [Fusarium vanettenii 77-13-4]EEU34680.1 hypothetical protein NECHADRAFT_82337 [Fusarium vanettenii 77-13-4]